MVRDCQRNSVSILQLLLPNKAAQWLLLCKMKGRMGYYLRAVRSLKLYHSSMMI